MLESYVPKMLHIEDDGSASHTDTDDIAALLAGSNTRSCCIADIDVREGLCIQRIVIPGTTIKFCM